MPFRPLQETYDSWNHSGWFSRKERWLLKGFLSHFLSLPHTFHWQRECILSSESQNVNHTNYVKIFMYVNTDLHCSEREILNYASNFSKYSGSTRSRYCFLPFTWLAAMVQQEIKMVHQWQTPLLAVSITLSFNKQTQSNWREWVWYVTTFCL